MTKLTVDIADELPADRSEWDAVVDASGRPNIFCRRDFLQAWLDHYREGRRLRIYCARRDRRLVAALPLIGQLGRTHFKGLTNHYMFTFAPICRYDDHEAIGEILRRAFSDRLLARIKLGQMDADEPLVASLPQLVEGLAGAGCERFNTSVPTSTPAVATTRGLLRCRASFAESSAERSARSNRSASTASLTITAASPNSTLHFSRHSTSRRVVGRASGARR